MSLSHDLLFTRFVVDYMKKFWSNRMSHPMTHAIEETERVGKWMKMRGKDSVESWGNKKKGWREWVDEWSEWEWSDQFRIPFFNSFHYKIHCRQLPSRGSFPPPYPCLLLYNYCQLFSLDKNTIDSHSVFFLSPFLFPFFLLYWSEGETNKSDQLETKNEKMIHSFESIGFDSETSISSLVFPFFPTLNTRLDCVN